MRSPPSQAVGCPTPTASPIGCPASPGTPPANVTSRAVSAPLLARHQHGRPATARHPSSSSRASGRPPPAPPTHPPPTACSARRSSSCPTFQSTSPSPTRAPPATLAPTRAPTRSAPTAPASAQRASTAPTPPPSRRSLARLATTVLKGQPCRCRAREGPSPTAATSSLLPNAQLALRARPAQLAHLSQRHACPAPPLPRLVSAHSVLPTSFKMTLAPPLARFAERAPLANTLQHRAAQ